jgi:hypothetical protein
MEILRITDHAYSIVYVNDNMKYNAYRRLSEDKWEILYREEWKNVQDTTELEELYNKRINGNGHE